MNVIGTHELLTRLEWQACKFASMKLPIGLDQSRVFINALFCICILYSSTWSIRFLIYLPALPTPKQLLQKFHTHLWLLYKKKLEKTESTFTTFFPVSLLTLPPFLSQIHECLPCVKQCAWLCTDMVTKRAVALMILKNEFHVRVNARIRATSLNLSQTKTKHPD